MAFESNNFKVARKVSLQKGEVNVECNIALSDEITKVLSVSGEAVLSGSEVLNGSLNYSGYVDVCIVYLNSEGEIGKVNSTCPFSSKFSSELIGNGNKADVFLKVEDISVQGVEAGSIKALARVEERAELVDNALVSSVKSSDDDICCRDENIKVVKFLGDANETFNVTSELNIRENLKRIILTESQVLVKNVESGNNFVSVSGDVVSRVLYLTENDKFESGYIYEGFKQEVELEGATRECQVEAYASIKRDTINVALAEEDKGGKVTLDVPVAISVKAYEEGDVLVVNDLYSTKNSLSITTESFEMSRVCQGKLIEGKIDGSLTLGEDRPRVDKIMFVGGNSVSISNSFLSDGEITLEGIARANVVYLNDEDSSLNSVALEVPFVINEKFDVENIDGQFQVDAIVCDVDVAVKKGRELFYDAKVKAMVNYCYAQVSGVITGVETTESLPEKDYGIELFFAKAGQNSWDVAKEAKVKEDMLLSQNSDTIFPLQQDEQIVLFYQKQN